MTRFPLDDDVRLRGADGDVAAVAVAEELSVGDDGRIELRLRVSAADAGRLGVPRSGADGGHRVAVIARLDDDVAVSRNAARLRRELERAGPLTEVANWTFVAADET